MLRAKAWTVRAPCLSSSRCPARSGASPSQHTTAERSCVGSGAPSTPAMMVSPREMSISSARRSVTDCGAKASSALPRPEVDPDHSGPLPGRQDDDLVADAHDPGGHGTGIPAIVLVRLVERSPLGPDDELDGQPERLARHVVRRRQRLEQFEQRRPRVPRRPAGPLDDVVPVERRDGDGAGLDDAEPGPRPDRGLDALEHVLRKPHEVDLVHRHDDVRHSQQRGHGQVPAGLLEDTLARVYQQHEDVGGR